MTVSYRDWSRVDPLISPPKLHHQPSFLRRLWTRKNMPTPLRSLLFLFFFLNNAPPPDTPPLPLPAPLPIPGDPRGRGFHPPPAAGVVPAPQTNPPVVDRRAAAVQRRARELPGKPAGVGVLRRPGHRDP